ncbi:glycoside hydrolase family 30 beta sandwich domain-containing protein [Hymenobacter sp. YC55]|uniref:glycoside hydrolase family 30 protein n=1 Tax=Hymenobacter sp. YC55 TaxID=3034019 RepID=UPI0023FA1E10|nr:glycoside hydrolase family 30 beta sandwich domain-containing protein [Hymenobacter sp. YC55]MDF7814786.1 glycoside hydrolase family 30 beta sandwich domain-containing protein [Hymenobacter sp. YC55]
MTLPTHFRCLASLFLVLSLFGGCQKENSPAGPTPTPTPTPTTPTGPSQVAQWLTMPDKSALFARQKVNLQFGTNTNQDPTIIVDTTQTYQTMDGFGYTFTGGSAQVMSQMAAGSRAELLKELFATDSTSLGISYLRVSIGASDLNDQVYTYDDSNSPDPTLANFSLAPDQAYFIPMLKEILAVNPNIKILGSPWTAPSWMKSNNSPKGGSLKPEYYDAYAQYFVKYIQGMRAAGITVDAVTLQNEPLNPNNNPSMVMQAGEQATFIKKHVGPAFRAANISTKIIAYDHNADQPNYPITVFNDAGARPFVDGSAFHLYGGTMDALTTVHDAYPGKNVYFTEQWTQAPGNFAADVTWHANNLLIAAPRNWSRNVLEWNLANDAAFGPHTTGGCTQCLGAITISANTVTRNPAYYSVAHASKFVRPGSVRVATNVPPNLPNVAYKTPNGKRVLMVVNTGSTLQKFNIQFKGKEVSTSLYGGAVATYIW